MNGRAAYQPPEQLVLDLDGYEGPLDRLLSLAREQKIDLTRISVQDLAEQYVACIERHRLRLEILADWLVMAAWIAYLKSRLLLPQAPADEPDPAEAAIVLEHRLMLLRAMQQSARRLTERPLLGRDVFARGAPEELSAAIVRCWRVDLAELLQAYGETCRRRSPAALTVEPSIYFSAAEMLEEFGIMLGRVHHWRALASLVPKEAGDGLARRSALAATFAAALELARNGRIELRQDRAFGPIWLRRHAPAPLRDAAAGEG